MSLQSEIEEHIKTLKAMGSFGVTGKILERALDATRWRDVEKELPEVGTTVLYFSKEAGHEISTYPLSPFEPLSVLNVTHWMPLPISPLTDESIER